MDSGPRKPLFGGNVGRKPVQLPPGVKAGSPEHLQWKRDKEAQRKRDERAAKRAVQPPPPLPPSTAPMPETLATAPDASPVPLGSEMPASLGDWTASDFNDAAPEVIELIEAWIVESNTELAQEGGLPAKVVRKIADDSAFPKSSKDSLRRTSPAMLAKFANWLRLPATLKPYISGVPAVAVICIGQFKTRQEIRRLILEDRKLREESKNTPANSQAVTIP